MVKKPILTLAEKKRKKIIAHAYHLDQPWIFNAKTKLNEKKNIDIVNTQYRENKNTSKIASWHCRYYYNISMWYRLIHKSS